MTGWLTMAQARAYLHCSTDYLLGLLDQGTVTAYARPGGKFALISRSDLDDVITSWPKAYADGKHRGGDGGRYYPGKGGDE